MKHQANNWTELSPFGQLPAAREDHQAMWLDAADGFYIFGGVAGGRGPTVRRPERPEIDTTQ